MIGRLQGSVVHKGPSELILDVHGVGYEISVSAQTYINIPDVGSNLTLFIHTIIREDGQWLYGFIALHERALFRNLIKVNGVGPKLALAILSSMMPEQFQFIVEQQDVASLCKVPGVGKKTAERLLMEMRGVLGDWSDGLHRTAMSFDPQNPHTPRSDAISALVALGYKPADATKVIHRLDDTLKSSDVLIREALQQL